MQGIRLIDCQGLLASVRKGKGAQVLTVLSTGKERNQDLGFCSSVVTKFIASHFLAGPLTPHKSCNICSACLVEASMIWPITV